jgi:hypothetical protein
MICRGEGYTKRKRPELSPWQGFLQFGRLSQFASDTLHQKDTVSSAAIGRLTTQQLVGYLLQHAKRDVNTVSRAGAAF